MESNRVPSVGLDYNFRILYLGDHNVGKQDILYKVRARNPGAARGRRHSMPVRNLSFEMFLNRGSKSVLMKIMDTGGQEKYRSLTASYYRGAHGCLVLYDVTKESSFENLNHWLHDLKEYTSQPEISTIIVGTKCHVDEDKREVTYERAQKYAESLNLPYMEVSAEEGINITEVFEKLADLIIESLNKDTLLSPIQPDTRGVTLISDTTKRKKQWCSC